MRKILILFLTIFIANIVRIDSVQAKEIQSFERQSNGLIWHDISELGSISKEDTYTYDEMLNHLINNGYSYKEAKGLMGERKKSSRASTEIRYSLFRLKTYSYGSYKLQPRFNVGLEYTKGIAAPNRIVSLQAAHIYTGDGAKCVFAGTIFYKLEAGNSFYYNFYGDIYKRGNINWSIGATVGVEETGSVSATISNGDDFYKNVSEAGRYTSAGLRP